MINKKISIPKKIILKQKKCRLFFIFLYVIFNHFFQLQVYNIHNKLINY